MKNQNSDSDFNMFKKLNDFYIVTSTKTMASVPDRQRKLRKRAGHQAPQSEDLLA